MHHAYCNLCGANFMNHPEGLTRNTWQTCSLFLEVSDIGLPHDLCIWNLLETTDITQDLLHRFVWKYPRIHWFITISPIEIKWYKFGFAGSTQCSDRPSWENVHVWYWYISGDIIGLMYPNQRDLGYLKFSASWEISLYVKYIYIYIYTYEYIYIYILEWYTPLSHPARPDLLQLACIPSAGLCDFQPSKAVLK